MNVKDTQESIVKAPIRSTSSGFYDHVEFQKQANEQIEALKKSEAKFRGIVELAKEGIIELDFICNILYCNSSFCSMTQYTESELCRKNLNDIIILDDGEKFKEYFLKYKTTDPKKSDIKLRTKSGTLIWVSYDVSIIRDDSNEIKGAYVIFTDISQRKENEFELIRTKEFYENILNSIPSDIVAFDKDQNYKFINPVAVKNAETRNWLIDKNDYDYARYKNMSTKNADARRKLFNDVVSGKKELAFEENLSKPGKDEWVLRRMTPIFDEEGNLKMVIGYGLDITNIKKAQMQLLQNEVLLKGVNDTSHIMLSQENYENAIDNVLKVLMEATGADRINIWENGVTDYGWICMSQRYSRFKDVEDMIVNDPELQNLAYQKVGFERWYEELCEGRVLKGCINNFPENERAVLEQFKIKSTLIVPIFSENQLWGMIGFDDCTNGREWTKYEENILSNVAISIGSYITKKRIEQDLIEAKQNAEDATLAKSRFLSTMSHEIRTPMNAVIGYTYLLMQENPKQYQLDYLKPLQFSANHLLALINDILDFSKIEAGKIEFEFIEFDLRETIDGIMKIFALKAAEKKINLDLILPNNLPDIIIGDIVRVNQILTNLVSNAVKFTEQGGVTIELENRNETKDKIEILFKVKDTGIGIPEDKLNHIFDSFTQANSSTTRKYGGTGLGLAISKKLIELLGGDIEVKSVSGEGTTFSFKIEFGKSKSLKIKKYYGDSKDEIFESMKGVKILIVEDNPVNAVLAEKFLKKWNIETETAENGMVAVERVQEKEFDLILLDLQMPEMNGYEAALTIRSLNGSYYKNVPIVALSAEVTAEVKKEVHLYGMNDSLTKPFNPSELYHSIKNLLKKF
ncbi:MAG: PAS domain S-box protein [Bacteroidetes bacterium]|nr:PAS domain S-box protein [Bacteroidota bacterium]